MSVLGVIPGMGGDAGGRAALAQLQAEKIGVQSYSVTPNGTFVFVRNNHYEMIRVVNVSINDVPCTQTNPSLPFTLDVGAQRTLFCADANESNVGELFDYSLQITWVEVSSGGRYTIDYRASLVGRVAEFLEGNIPEIIDEEGPGGAGGSVDFQGCTQAESIGSVPDVFYNGSGTLSEPYGICNVTMLQAINQNLSAHYVLLDDIDATGFSFEPIGNEVTPFEGSLNGQGNVIKGLSFPYDMVGGSKTGLFEYNSGNVSNLGIKDSYTLGAFTPLATLASHNQGNIDSVYCINCLVDADPLMSGYCQDSNARGILVAYNSGTISNSYTINSSINYCSFGPVGGFVGVNQGNVFNSYSLNIYFYSSSPSGFSVGSLVGLNYGTIESGTIENSYFTNADFDNGLGELKTEAEMQQQATFENWDFDTVWAIVEDESFPWLQNVKNPFE